MKHKKQDLDKIIEKTTDIIRHEQIDDSSIKQSADRVWAKINQELAGENVASMSNFETTEESFKALNVETAVEQIGGCADFQSLIPAYLKGNLATARKLLLEDHVNECIPCRRELKSKRVVAKAKKPTFFPRQQKSGQATVQNGFMGMVFNRTNVVRWSVSVGIIICLGLAGIFLYERLDLSGVTMAATVENVNGEVYVFSNSQESRKLGVGEQLMKGEFIRTAKNSNAVLRLADGSTVEMRERSEFSVSENMRGVTVKLDRGDVIVEAAKQHNKRLFVQTPDSLVSVKGTIFAVESGTKGSRVSVVEGEVEVKHAGQNETLLPGDQTTTNRNLGKKAVSQTVAWSRNAGRYANLVAELSKLRNDINQQVTLPGVRYSSKLVQYVPENAVFYAGLPNLSEKLAESNRIMQERISQNPTLAEWWKNNRQGNFGLNEQTLSSIFEFGSHLGEEIAISASMDEKGEPSKILFMGEVKNSADFRSYLNEKNNQLLKESGVSLKLKVVDDPITAKVDNATASRNESSKTKTNGVSTKNFSANNELFVWIHNDIFVASPQIESLRDLANGLNSSKTNALVNSGFYQRINDIYHDGAGIVVAADLEKIIAQNVNKETRLKGEERQQEALKKIGVTSLRHFIAEQKVNDGKTLSRAVLTFNESNQGIFSWLAAPAPMGALDFISPNANIATAFVVKKPELLVDELLEFIETVEPDLHRQMKDMEKQQGFSIRNDFAVPLGGEFAFAIDGPIFPSPSWKVILEVYDQPKLQETFERLVEKLNRLAEQNGKGKLTLEKVNSGSQDFYAIKSSEAAFEVNYTFMNGYLIVAPSRALLEQSIKNYNSGNTLVRSSRFMSVLPKDGNPNFSAVLYHDLAALIGPLADKLKSAGGEGLTEEQRQMLSSIEANNSPTLVYGYAQENSLTLATNTEGGAFGLNPATLIGLPNSFEMQQILMNALGDKNVEKK